MQNLFMRMRTYCSSLMLRWYQSNLKPFESPMLFLFIGWSFGKVFTFQVNLPRYLFFFQFWPHLLQKKHITILLTSWGVKFVALFNLVKCLGGFCTSTRTSCQTAWDSLIFSWFLPLEKTSNRLIICRIFSLKSWQFSSKSSFEYILHTYKHSWWDTLHLIFLWIETKQKTS